MTTLIITLVIVFIISILLARYTTPSKILNGEEPFL